MLRSRSTLDRSKRSLPCRKQNNSDRGVFPCRKPQKEGYGGICNVGDFEVHIQQLLGIQRNDYFDLEYRYNAYVGLLCYFRRTQEKIALNLVQLPRQTAVQYKQ